MAFVTTTLASPASLSDVSIVVASATGVAAGMFARCDGEIMQVAKSYTSGVTIPVQRGLESAASTHKITANVTFGLASDFASPPAGLELGVTNPVTPAFPMFSYSTTATAITPVQGIHIINGTGALALTLANPTKDQDGQIMFIMANGKAAHTVTYAAGVGNGGATMDVGTFNATEATGCALMAVNGFWVLWANGIGSAGTQVAGVVWA